MFDHSEDDIIAEELALKGQRAEDADRVLRLEKLRLYTRSR